MEVAYMQVDRHDYRQVQEWRSKVHAGSSA